MDTAHVQHPTESGHFWCHFTKLRAREKKMTKKSISRFPTKCGNEFSQNVCNKSMIRLAQMCILRYAICMRAHTYINEWKRSEKNINHQEVTFQPYPYWLLYLNWVERENRNRHKKVIQMSM